MCYFCKYGTSSSVISDIPGGYPPTLSALASGNHSSSLRAVTRNKIPERSLGEEGGVSRRDQDSSAKEGYGWIECTEKGVSLRPLLGTISPNSLVNYSSINFL